MLNYKLVAAIETNGKVAFVIKHNTVTAQDLILFYTVDLSNLDSSITRLNILAPPVQVRLVSDFSDSIPTENFGISYDEKQGYLIQFMREKRANAAPSKKW